jgi:indolepyruvate ferredoxin oxidoreductase
MSPYKFQAERQLILDYESDLGRALAVVSPHNVETVIELARVPAMIRGFGHVKAGNAERARRSKARILDCLGLV